jgi:hypothetical protein
MLSSSSTPMGGPLNIPFNGWYDFDWPLSSVEEKLLAQAA